VKKCTDYEVKL